MNQITVPFLRQDAFEPEPADELDVGRLLGAARRRWPLAALGFVAGIALAVLYLATTPATYTAMARVLVEEPTNRVLEEVSPTPAIQRTDATMLTEMEIIGSTELAERIVRNLNLDSNPVFMNPPSSLLERVVGGAMDGARRGVAAVRERAFGVPPPAVPDTAPRTIGGVSDELVAAAVARLQSGLIVGRAGRSYAISIGFEAPTPELARDIANAYTRAYVADGLDAGLSASERAADWMQGQLDRLGGESGDAALEAARFRASNDLATAGGQLLTEQQLGELTTQLVLARGETARAETRLAQFEEAADRPLDGAVAETRMREDGQPPSSALAELRESYRAVDDRAREVARRFGGDHPQAVALREQRDALARSIDNELDRTRQTLVNARDTARAREEALEASVGEVTGRNARAMEAQAQLTELERRAEALSAVYTGMLERFGVLTQQSSYPIARARVLSDATLPSGKSAPSSSRTLALLAVLGTLAGAALGALLELRDGTLRSSADVRRAVSAPFLGYVPRIGTRRPTRRERRAAGAPTGIPEAAAGGAVEGGVDGTGEAPADRAPPATYHPARRSREVARMLAGAASHGTPLAETLAAVRFAADATGGVGRGGVVIGVTSPEGGEGATTLAANLAAQIARGGSSTLLIDADVHAATASRRLAPGASGGIVDALRGGGDWRSLARPVAGAEFAFLPAGAPDGVGGSAVPLGSPAMRRLMAEARELFDYVVIDVPPLALASGARALAPSIDGFAVVGRWGGTTGAMLHDAIADGGIGDRVVGVILNGANPRRVPRYDAPMGRVLRSRARAKPAVGVVPA